MRNTKEVLVEIRNFVQQRREEGEDDLRPIIHFINEKIDECDTVEGEKNKQEENL